MKLIVLATAIFFSIGTRAQTAKVIALSPQEAATAQKLDAEQKSIEDRVKAFRDSLTRKYLMTNDSSSGKGSGSILLGNSTDISTPHYYKTGWGFGAFEFSEDWKYIVPIPEPRYQNSLGISGGCQYVSPTGVVTTGTLQ